MFNALKYMLEDFSSNSKGCVSYCLELSERERAEDFDTLRFPALKYSSYIGLNNNSNSCCDVVVLSAGGTTFKPALNLTIHCCGLELRVLNCYDQKS
ncbi:hypothetical protein Tco_0246925 [Tanacetum coccineum]